MAASGMDSFLGIRNDSAANAQADWVAKHSGVMGGSPSFSVSVGNGRNGGNCFRAGGSTATFAAGVDAAATIYAGGAFRPVSLTAGEIIALLDPTVTHITFTQTTSGAVEIRRGAGNGTILATSAAGAITAGGYQYVEIKVTVANAGGFAEMLVNGVSVVSFTGDTQNGGTATVTQPRWMVPVNTSDWTDIYYNQSGYWGDGRVECIKPTAEGNASDLTPSSGTDNALMVDDQTPDDDSTYVSSATAGHKDTHVTENLASTSGTVQAVQCVVRVRKDDAGARSIVTVARLSGTEADSAAVTVNTTYGYARDVRTTKPGGGAWAISDVNSSEFGYKVNA